MSVLVLLVIYKTCGALCPQHGGRWLLAGLLLHRHVNHDFRVVGVVGDKQHATAAFEV